MKYKIKFKILYYNQVQNKAPWLLIELVFLLKLYCSILLNCENNIDNTLSASCYELIGPPDLVLQFGNKRRARRQSILVFILIET